MSPKAPRRGDTFLHARRITGSPKAGTARPVEMTVTRVTATTVYYRPSDGGSCWSVGRDAFPASVKA